MPAIEISADTVTWGSIILGIFTAIGALITVWYKNTPNRVKEMQARRELAIADAAAAKKLYEEALTAKQAAFDETIKVERANHDKETAQLKSFLTEAVARTQEVKKLHAECTANCHKVMEAHKHCLEEAAYMKGKLDIIESMQHKANARMEHLETLSHPAPIIQVVPQHPDAVKIDDSIPIRVHRVDPNTEDES